MGHENPAGPPGSYVPHGLASLAQGDHAHAHMGHHPMFGAAGMAPPQFRTDLSALAMAAAVAAGQTPFMTPAGCPPPPGLMSTAAGDLVWPPGMVHPSLQSLIYFNQAAAAAAMANANPMMTPGLAWPAIPMKTSPPAPTSNGPAASVSPTTTKAAIGASANGLGQPEAAASLGNPALPGTPNSVTGGLGPSISETASPASNGSPCAVDPRKRSIDVLRMKAKEHAAALCENAGESKRSKHEQSPALVTSSSSASNSPSNSNCGKCIEGF